MIGQVVALRSPIGMKLKTGWVLTTGWQYEYALPVPMKENERHSTSPSQVKHRVTVLLEGG